MTRRVISLICSIVFILTSCEATKEKEIPTATLTPKPTGVLTTYHTLTPSPDSPTSTVVVIIPVTPAPTPTPFLHTITNDDTLLGIAYLYGISLEELQAANPGVDSHYLTVGKQLIIPISGEIPQTLPTPTPAAVDLDQPHCYWAGDGGAWCVVEVRNDHTTSVENLSAWIGLYTHEGEIIAGKVAYAPLNILRPDETIPLFAYFEPPIAGDFEARSELLSGLEMTADDLRYLNLEVNVSQVSISTDGKQATLHGEVSLPRDTPMPTQLWALIVAYNERGNIIGMRKWESGGEVVIDLTIFSLEGVIDHVEVLIEARP